MSQPDEWRRRIEGGQEAYRGSPSNADGGRHGGRFGCAGIAARDDGAKQQEASAAEWPCRGVEVSSVAHVLTKFRGENKFLRPPACRFRASGCPGVRETTIRARNRVTAPADRPTTGSLDACSMTPAPRRRWQYSVPARAADRRASRLCRAFGPRVGSTGAWAAYGLRWAILSRPARRAPAAVALLAGRERLSELTFSNDTGALMRDRQIGYAIWRTLPFGEGLYAEPSVAAEPAP